MSLQYVSFFVGAGYSDAALSATDEVDLDFIGADAGTIDVGPYQLAGVGSIFSEDLCRHDLRRALVAARRKRIPLIIGSCGGSGSDAGVNWFARLVHEIAGEERLRPFRVARIYAEVDRSLVKRRIAEGRVRALAGAPFEYTAEVVDRSTRLVGVMGVAPFVAALDAGADVVLAGRATDAAIFAAQPLRRGHDEAVSWHAAKVAECGAAIAEPARNDLLRVAVDADSFVVSPLTSAARCTPWSVAAHQLYENADPTLFVEPSGILDASDVRYDRVDDSAVRISGATFATSALPSMKLEGVEPAGFQSIAMASYNDRVLLETLPAWTEGVQAEIAAKVDRVFGAASTQAQLTIRAYGSGNGSDLFHDTHIAAPGADVFFLVDVVAPTQAMATAVATVAWHTLAHFPTPGWSGGFGTAAWPFNPPVIERGQIYRFNVNHVMELDHELEGVRTEYEEAAR